jgi:hypothetical protein
MARPDRVGLVRRSLTMTIINRLAVVLPAIALVAVMVSTAAAEFPPGSGS